MRERMRVLWGVVAMWAVIGSAYLLEPLLAVGPGALVLLTEPVVLPAVVAVLVVLAGGRLLLAAVRGVTRRTAAAGGSGLGAPGVERVEDPDVLDGVATGGQGVEADVEVP